MATRVLTAVERGEDDKLLRGDAQGVIQQSDFGGRFEERYYR